MLYITDEAVAAALDYSSVATELDCAYRDLAAGRAAIHPRQRTRVGTFRLNTMGALWDARGVAGVKAYTAVDGAFHFVVTLFDSRLNRTLAVLAGTELTRLRTAAQTALIATKIVSAPVKKIALFGAGFQGRAQAEALAALMEFEEVAVVDPNASPQWCASFSKETGIHIYVASPERAVRGAQLVVTATKSGTPVFDGNCLDDNAAVIAIGTSTAAGRELDDVVMDRAGAVIVEWKPQSLNEAGELVLWSNFEQGCGKVVDLAQLYAAEAAWPSAKNSITVFKSVGTGLADVAAAWLAYQRVLASASQKELQA